MTKFWKLVAIGAGFDLAWAAAMGDLGLEVEEPQPSGYRRAATAGHGAATATGGFPAGAGGDGLTAGAPADRLHR